jgi:hypothetical protein
MHFIIKSEQARELDISGIQRISRVVLKSEDETISDGFLSPHET